MLYVCYVGSVGFVVSGREDLCKLKLRVKSQEHVQERLMSDSYQKRQLLL